MPLLECNAIYAGLSGNNTTAFLRSNVVRTGTGSEHDYPTYVTRYFDFTDEGPTAQGGRVYEHVSPNDPHLVNGPFEVSYLPWRINAGYYIILEPNGGPDIMMTAVMSGCSVGYIRAADGAVRVSHHNLQADDANAAQRRTLAFADDALHPNEYRDVVNLQRGDISFTSQSFGAVFGVRRNGNWTMYGQITIDWRQKNVHTNQIIASAISIRSAGRF